MPSANDVSRPFCCVADAGGVATQALETANTW
jgi:hypothetical protein